MLGYYNETFKNEYVDLAVDTMRRISMQDLEYPYLNKYRDHIIFVEQKLLPMFTLAGRNKYLKTEVY